VNAVCLRFADPPEREALEDLQRRASLIYDAYRADLLANPDLIALPRWQLEDRRVRLAEKDGVTLGFSAVLPRDTKTCDLDGLFVEPAQWRRGIGRALMEDAFALARAEGKRTMEVLANPYAEDFYLRLGFVRIGIATTALGIAAKMRRSLDGLGSELDSRGGGT
jgi:GNAT superfamily N-acetyltransferase